MRLTSTFTRFGVCMLFSMLSIGILSQPAMAEPTAAQKRDAAALRNRVRAAGQLYVQKKYRESGEAIKAAQAEAARLTADGNPDMVKLVLPLYTSLETARKLLEKQGVTVPAMEKPTAKTSIDPFAPKPPTTPPATPPTPAAGVSFVKDVAPMLVSKCGRCHISKSAGGFSMKDFASLMRGPAEGVVITPGSDASRIIVVIEEGDMPRGGGKVAASDLALLKKWVVSGAKFDGDNTSAPLASLAPGSSVPTATPPTEIKKATGNETVKFSVDIAPILAANCNGCHVNAPRVRGGLNMSNFKAMMAGGDSGSVVTPGNAAQSLLVQKLKGEGGGQRMPIGRPPLKADAMAKIEKWIAEGATFDGNDAGEDIVKLAARAKAENSTHDELAAERATNAALYWRTAMQGIDAKTLETDSFVVMGNIKQDQLNAVGEAAKTIAPKLAEMFGAASDQPLVKGKITLFAFQQRYDYSEFGTMIEKRTIPKEVRGHWRFNVVDAYGAIIPARREEYGIDALVGQQLAGIYISSLTSSPPRWFAEGVGRVAASKISPEDARVKLWDERLPGAKSSVRKIEDFFAGKLPAEDTDVIAYGFADYIMKDDTRFQKLLGDLRKGTDFEAAFKAAYGGTPLEVMSRW